MGQCRFKAVLVLVVWMVALVVSLYRAFHDPVKTPYGLSPFGDSYLYQRLAYNLYEGRGFSATDNGQAFGLPYAEQPRVYEPCVTRGPVYPLFLCSVYRAFGDPKAMASVQTWHVNWDRVRIVQCVLHSLTCLLVFFLVKTVWPEGFWSAVAAALIQALCFYNLFYTRTLLSESITTFVLTAFIVLGVLALKTNKAFWWLLSGLLFGLTVLSRPEYLLFPIAFVGYVAWVHRGQGWVCLRNAFLFVGAILCVVAPWTIRNYHVSKHLVPVSTSEVGYNLYYGTFESRQNWKDWGVVSDAVFYLPGEKERFQTLDASFHENHVNGSASLGETDAAFMHLALERIRSRPLDCLGNWIAKMPRLWYQDYIPMYLEREASGNWFIFYFVFACLAFWPGVKEQRVLMGLIALIFLYLNLIFLPLHIEPRYGVALMPGITALAGIGLGKTCAWIRTRLAV